jgi:hypothetical protein
MEKMFEKCYSLINLVLPIVPYNIFVNINKYDMFIDCPKLKDIPGWYKNLYKKK